MLSKERAAKAPFAIRAIFAASLLLQIGWSGARPPPVAVAEALPAAPSPTLLALLALDEPGPVAKILMLWLQAFDNQPGLSVSFNQLDYGRVINWLDAILDLDGRFQYPLLSASRIYTEAARPDKKKRMLAFVHRRFLEDPEGRWPWMAHAVYVAKHRLGDKPLALEYAKALRLNLSGDAAPPWASQMEIYALEELGEIEDAKRIIGGLLASGRFADNPQELRFLKNKLATLESKRY